MIYIIGDELNENDPYYIISNRIGEKGSIRYMPLDEDNNLFPDNYLLSPTFTSFLKLLIDQNGGYIQNLSEIYEEMVKNGFK